MTRVAVVGAGAIGGVWAAHLAGAGRGAGGASDRLAGAGHEVALVDTSPAVVAALQADGLILVPPDGLPSGAPSGPQRALQIGASERAQDVGPVEVVNGAVVRAGAGLGLPVPLNRAMLALVLGLERASLGGASEAQRGSTSNGEGRGR